MNRELNDIRVFVSVVEARSFTAAAKLLGMPVSSVSRRVARLEEALEARLLQRTTRKLSLTDAGQLYYERGAAGLAQIEDAESMLAAARTSPKGRVRLAAPAEQGIMMPLLSEFMQAHPDVRVEVEFTTREANIAQDGFDASVHAGPVTNLSVVAHRLIDSPFAIVASPSYLKRAGSPTSVSDLSEHRCVIFGAST